MFAVQRLFFGQGDFWTGLQYRWTLCTIQCPPSPAVRPITTQYTLISPRKPSNGTKKVFCKPIEALHVAKTDQSDFMQKDQSKSDSCSYGFSFRFHWLRSKSHSRSGFRFIYFNLLPTAWGAVLILKERLCDSESHKMWFSIPCKLHH